MFENLLKYDIPKVIKIKIPKEKKICMPPLSVLPAGKERTLLYQRLYKQVEENKESNKEYGKKYYKPYYEKNKDKLMEKIMCECGIEYKRYNKCKHIKSKRHINKLLELQENNSENNTENK